MTLWDALLQEIIFIDEFRQQYWGIMVLINDAWYDIGVLDKVPYKKG